MNWCRKKSPQTLTLLKPCKQDFLIKQFYKITFLNPRSAQVFQTLAKDLSRQWSPSQVLTDTSGIICFESTEDLQVNPVPRCASYNRKNIGTRAVSMMSYFVYVFVKAVMTSRKSLLFLVTMPPYLGLIGYTLKKLRGQKYVMLVYDILPDVLVSGGLMKEGVVVKLWRRLNRVILNNADAVITIGEYMADNLKRDFDVSKTSLGHIAVIHNWEDVELIKPFPKEQNPFIQEQGLQDKFIVMYSGNIGATHDMETLVEAAKKLKTNTDIIFVIIGEGAKREFVLDFKEKQGLDNMLMMSYLPQNQLPYSIPAADISIVTIANGVEGYLVPCKFYSYLAAGNAVIAICNPKCEVADIINNEQCGKVVALGDVETLVDSIMHYYENKEDLDQAQRNSRKASQEKYSRKNTQQYIEIIQKIYPSGKSAGEQR